MDVNVKNIVAFTIGAIAGSIVTWELTKKKYMQMANDEIQIVRDYYRNSEKNKNKETGNNDDESNDEAEREEYENIINSRGYTNYSKKEEEEENLEKPYVISPDDFDENGYKTITLTYYSDGILSDERGNIIEDVDDVVGEDALTSFGEYEDDSVFVRDDRRETDYEILADDEKYSDVFANY